MGDVERDEHWNLQNTHHAGGNGVWMTNTHTHGPCEDSCTEIHRPPEIEDNTKWMTEGEVTTHTESNKDVNIDTRIEGALVFLDTWSVIYDDGLIKTKLQSVS